MGLGIKHQATINSTFHGSNNHSPAPPLRRKNSARGKKNTRREKNSSHSVPTYRNYTAGGEGGALRQRTRVRKLLIGDP